MERIFPRIFKTNTIKINGVVIQTDSILSGSSSELVVKVPKGCGTGPVTVDVDADLTNGGSPPVFHYQYVYRVTTLAGTPNVPGSSGTSVVYSPYQP